MSLHSLITRPRPMSRPVAGVLVAVLAATLTFQPSSALADTPGTIQASHCSSWTSWEGQNFSTGASANYAARGSVRHCVTRYKLTDSDPSAKYFFVSAESEYVFSDGKRNLPANAYIYIKSSAAAASNVYDATDSYTSSTDCSTAIRLSLAAGPVSASVPVQACSSYGVNRTSRDANGAGWNAPNAGAVRRFGTGYLIKIPESASTVFTVTFYKPNFTHTWNGTYWIESGGYTKWEDVL